LRLVGSWIFDKVFSCCVLCAWFSHGKLINVEVQLEVRSFLEKVLRRSSAWIDTSTYMVDLSVESFNIFNLLWLLNFELIVVESSRLVPIVENSFTVFTAFLPNRPFSNILALLEVLTHAIVISHHFGDEVTLSDGSRILQVI
jgi:hypothetical protein